MATLNYRNLRAWGNLWTSSCLGSPFQLWQTSPAAFPKSWLRFVNGNALEVQKSATHRQSGCISRAGPALHSHRAASLGWVCCVTTLTTLTRGTQKTLLYWLHLPTHWGMQRGFFHKQWAMVPMCIKAYTVSKQDENNGRQSYSKATQIACIIQSHTERVW